jgi:hypothetical protein
VVRRRVGDAVHDVVTRRRRGDEVTAAAVEVAGERVARDADALRRGEVVVEVEVRRVRVARVHRDAEEAALAARVHAGHRDHRCHLHAGPDREHAHARGELLDVDHAAVGQEVESGGHAQARGDRLDRDAIGNDLGADREREDGEQDEQGHRARGGHRRFPSSRPGARR